MQSLWLHARVLHSALQMPSLQSTCRQAVALVFASSLHDSEQSVQVIHASHVSWLSSLRSHSHAAVYAALSIADMDS